MGTVDGGWYRDYEINPNTAYPTGEHYFYVVITLSPSDKNSTVEPVSTKSDILKIDFTERETTMDGAGTEQNPYIIKTTEHLSEIQKMVADGDSFAGAYFQIANDVSLPTSWTPIGTRDTAFSGNIDGNHKKLTVPAGEKPLLGCINGASVKDLDIYGEQIEGAGLVNDFTGVGLSGSAIVLDNVTLKSGSKTLKSGLVAAGAGNGYASASAGFVMTMDGEIDGMGTEQSYYALTAYYRFLSGKTNLYDMTDIIDMGGDVVTVEPTVPAATEPAQANTPWWIIVVCIFGGVGWGIVIGVVLVPKLKKKD